MTEREILETVLKNHHEMRVLQHKQRQIEAQLIRACVTRLGPTTTRAAKAGALDSLISLAEMLEKGE